jgi:osmoprotectant transport system permease protein
MVLLVGLVLAGGPARAADPARVTVGSKKFTESVILGEMVAHLARHAGVPVEHRRELGGSTLLWKALLAGDIDVYAEYSGTLTEELLHIPPDSSDDVIGKALAAHGVRATRSLGFEDSYALGIRGDLARQLNLRSLSDLRSRPELRLGFSDEFLNRADGWPGLRERYRLPQTQVRGLDHDLAYRGLKSGDLDGTDLYTTDAEIRFYKLTVLEDDLHYFPPYQATLIYRADLEDRFPQAVEAFRRLEGRISEAAMTDMNERAKIKRVPESQAAATFLLENFNVAVKTYDEGLARTLLRLTVEHLRLVAVSLVAAIVIAVPLGVLAAKRQRAGQVLLAIVGIMQTIPSLALLSFLIPLVGIGSWPAMVALFVYSLLPIVRNTYTGLRGIPNSMRESAQALGLPPSAVLRLVELPMAMPTILAGIKTAAVINVGTATLGALIGAGGYGQPIFSGIRLDDVGLILEGAIPAALLALAVQGAFELTERFLVPRGLRLKPIE